MPVNAAFQDVGLGVMVSLIVVTIFYLVLIVGGLLLYIALGRITGQGPLFRESKRSEGSCLAAMEPRPRAKGKGAKSCPAALQRLVIRHKIKHSR
jgi:hypothetical protein